MKIATGALVALLAATQSVQAAPKVSGKYSFMGWNFCQPAITTIQDNYAPAGNPNGSRSAVRQINPTQSGEMMVEAGYITFPATATSSGQMAFTTTTITGSALKLNTAGSAVIKKTEADSGVAFTVTETTLDLGGDLWIMTYGDLVSGVARTLDLVRRVDALCISAIHATKQKP